MAARVLPVKAAFDERVEDGLTARHGIDLFVKALEDPERYFGCLAEDGSDDHPVWPQAID